MIPGLPQVGGMELIILLSIILLFFGAKRIPSLARSLGGGIREFRKGVSGAYAELEEGKESHQTPMEEADELEILLGGRQQENKH
jgi:sec-independent protein translocase protein TatA